MTIEIHELQRVAFTEEATGAANFALDVTGSATFLDLPIQGVASVVLKQDTLDPNIQQQRKDARNSTILGPKSAELTFTMPIGSHGVPAGDGVTSPAHTVQAWMWFLKTAYGGANDANTGTDVASTTNAYQMVATDATAFDGGEVVGWVNAAGNLEARTLTSAGAAITLREGFTATPSTSDVLYAGNTFYPTENPLTSMQFIVEGAEQDDRWLLKGGQITAAPSFSISLGDIATVSFTITFADWDSEPAAAITLAAYQTFEPCILHSVRVVNAAAPTSGECLDVATLGVTMNGPTFMPVKSACGTNTIKRFVRGRVVPMVSVTMSIPFEDLSWFTEKTDREYYGIYIQLGNAAGKTFLLEIPKAQTDDVQRNDEGGIANQTLTFSSTVDSYVDASADDDDIRYAAIRLHAL